MVGDITKGNGIGVVRTDGAVQPMHGPFDYAIGMAFDPAGNLYFGYLKHSTDQMHLMLSTPEGHLEDLGQLYRRAGGEASWKFDLAVSPQGEIYFNHQDAYLHGRTDVLSGIAKRDCNGVIRPVASGIPHAEGLAFDEAGNLYFTSKNDNVVNMEKITPEGTLSDLGVIIHFTTYELDWGIDLAVSPAGEIYFNYQYDTVKGNGGIAKMDSKGVISIVKSGYPHAVGLAFDPDGTLYFGAEVASGAFDLMRLKPNGNLIDMGNILRQYSGTESWSFDLALSPVLRTVPVELSGFAAE